MALFTVEELREVISVKVLAGDPSPSAKRRIRGISSDSRSIRRGDLFVALKGDRFDGHDFVPAVLAQGAAGAIVHDEYRLPQSKGTGVKASGRVEPFIFGVRDPLFAYQQLATHHRSRFEIPVVAVTGSNGKTTTKEMVASVLAQRFNAMDGILSGQHPVEDFKLNNAESTVSGVTVSCEAVEETCGTF